MIACTIGEGLPRSLLSHATGNCILALINGHSASTSFAPHFSLHNYFSVLLCVSRLLCHFQLIESFLFFIKILITSNWTFTSSRGERFAIADDGLGSGFASLYPPFVAFCFACAIHWNRRTGFGMKAKLNVSRLSGVLMEAWKDFLSLSASLRSCDRKQKRFRVWNYPTLTEARMRPS